MSSTFSKDISPKHIGILNTDTPKSGQRSLLPEQYETLTQQEQRLINMLTYKRPAGSKAEAKFINRFIRPLGVQEDAFGNLYKIIGKDSPVLWSSHTDSVHSRGGRQKVDLSDTGFLTAPGSDCLGADCASGVWLMGEMIRLGIEGTYVFHREEECGGNGSQWIADNNRALLKPIRYAIAFDRHSYTSIITHQFGQRCCSTTFATALAVALGTEWKLDDGGTFTDTANYMDIIPECTNISVGYFGQHTYKEAQHLGSLVYLLGTLASINVEDLPEERDPKVTELRDYGNKSSFDRYNTHGYLYDDKDYSDAYDPRLFKDSEASQMLEVIQDHPDAVAALLSACGITADDILTEAYR